MKLNSKSMRNGELDFLKFVFAVVIMLFHANALATGDEKALFGSGALAVEFFFIVSGYFFIPSVDRFAARKKEKHDNVFKEDIAFIGSKIKSILPYLVMTAIFAGIMMVIYYLHIHEDDFSLAKFSFVISKSVWDIFLLNANIPIKGADFNGVQWYLSAMFIAMFIFYPLIRKKREIFVKYICPISVLFFIGIIAAGGTLGGHFAATKLLITRGMLRALMEIMIGCMIYCVSQRLAEISLTIASKVLLTAVSSGCIVYSLIMMNFNSKYYLGKNTDGSVGLVVLAALSVAVTIIAARADVINGLFNNKLSGFLGKLSLVLYLVHMPCRRIVLICFEDYSYAASTGIMIALSFAVSALFMAINYAISKASPKLTPKIKKIFVK